VSTWAHIPGFDGYVASDAGIIARIVFGNLETLSATKERESKYLRVRLITPDGKFRRKRVHVLVAMAFLDHKVGSGMEVHHIDGDVGNNSVGNLKLVTTSEHRALHGTVCETL